MTGRGKLEELARRYHALDREPPPMLAILGEARRERFWESLLAFFLDPTNPHGFGTDVLDAFLEAITSHPDTTLSGSITANRDTNVQTHITQWKNRYYSMEK